MLNRDGIHSFSQNPHSLLYPNIAKTKLGTVSTDRTEISPFKITSEKERWLTWSSLKFNLSPKNNSYKQLGFLLDILTVKAPFWWQWPWFTPKLLPSHRLQMAFSETSWSHNSAASIILLEEQMNLDKNSFTSKFFNGFSSSQCVVMRVEGQWSLSPLPL